MCRNLLFENSGCDERLVSGSWVVAPQPNTVHSSVVVGQLLRVVLERKSNCDRVLRTEFQRTPVAFGSAVCDWNQLRRSFFWTALSAVKSYGQEAGERQESLHLDRRIEKVGVMCSMPEQLPLIYRCGDWCNDQKSVQRQCIHVLFLSRCVSVNQNWPNECTECTYEPAQGKLSDIGDNVVHHLTPDNRNRLTCHPLKKNIESKEIPWADGENCGPRKFEGC